MLQLSRAAAYACPSVHTKTRVGTLDAHDAESQILEQEVHRREYSSIVDHSHLSPAQSAISFLHFTGPSSLSLRLVTCHSSSDLLFPAHEPCAGNSFYLSLYLQSLNCLIPRVQQTMLDGDRVPVRTASDRQSIWKNINENEFRQRAVALQRASSEVPGNTKVYTENDWLAYDNRGKDSACLIPFSVEQQISDDLAFVAAADEAVKAVSAVALEILDDPPCLNIRLAVNDKLPQAVPETFRMIFDILGKCARRRTYFKYRQLL